MHILGLLALAGTISATKISQRSTRNYKTHDYYAVQLDPLTNPEHIASHLGIDYDGQLSFLDDHHIFRHSIRPNDVVEEALLALKYRRTVKRDLQPHILDSIKSGEKQQLRRRLVKRSLASSVDHRAAADVAVAQRSALAMQLKISDPIFNDQWHLFNTVQPGNDLNVTGLWTEGITGKGATVCIIDDGIDMDSEDLRANYFAKGSYDFNDGDDDPRPILDDDKHGTRCAGEVAAVKNDVCGIGIAYDAKVSGIRILSAPIPDIDEAEAVIYGYQDNDIYSCSWGPPDDGRTMAAPGILIRKAIWKAIQKGRGGKGTIYVFAAGNGAAAQDNCNFDGYTNSIYSITIGAVDKTNSHPYYSERCSAQLAVTYSSGAGDAIHTTDVGPHRCTESHGGTSAAGPIVAGVYALALQVRPELTWRDIQWITLLTSHPIYKEELENQWQITATGRQFSHQYGYGKIDAYSLVQLAKTWKLVSKQAWYFSPWIHVRHAIPQVSQGLKSTFTITEDMLKKDNLKQVEHVTVTMNIDHDRRGDISVELHSPFGVVSHLSESRRYDDAPVGYKDWTFMSVAHFGETGIGEWVILVKDNVENDKTGRLVDWRIKLFGESINPEIQGSMKAPKKHEDDDHDVDSTMGNAATTSIAPSRSSTSLMTHTGLPIRPTIVKPSGDLPSNTVTTATATATATTAGSGSSSQASAALDLATATATPTSSFLSSPFPMFGFSKRTQVWISGALALIILFCLSLGGYFYIQRRRRLANDSRDNYEFAMLNDQDEMDSIIPGAVGKRKRGRRAGELYDAFAGESDEELCFDDEGELYDAYQDARLDEQDEKSRLSK